MEVIIMEALVKMRNKGSKDGGCNNGGGSDQGMKGVKMEAGLNLRNKGSKDGGHNNGGVSKDEE